MQLGKALINLNRVGAQVNWIRLTGISDHVKIRPREYVRDAAEHSF